MRRRLKLAIMDLVLNLFIKSFLLQIKAMAVAVETVLKVLQETIIVLS